MEKAIHEAVFVVEQTDKKWPTVEAASASKTYRPSNCDRVVSALLEIGTSERFPPTVPM